MDPKELGKLSPEERLKHLKKLEEGHKKDLEEASDLIKKTEAELKKAKEIPKIEVPKLEPVDISKIFEPENSLEGTVKKEDKEEDTGKVTYQGNADNKTFDMAPHQEKRVKRSEELKYESAVEQVDALHAARAAAKELKKYQRG